MRTIAIFVFNITDLKFRIAKMIFVKAEVKFINVFAKLLFSPLDFPSHTCYNIYVSHLLPKVPRVPCQEQPSFKAIRSDQKSIRHIPKSSNRQSENHNRQFQQKLKKANKTQKKALPNTGASAQVRQCLIILPIPQSRNFK